VGGYRGLGLAYAQAGDSARALSALRTYVTAVPNARDAALIRKRIARLQGK
jgi:regulator of sirC expression with transglutaminase-like and TPR domain